MDRIILGDNPFFGVDHRCESNGMANARRFQRTEAITDVLDCAYDEGIHAFSFSTHDRVREICDHFRAQKSRFSDLRVYPALPYAHKYADLVNEKGILGAVTDTIASDGTVSGVASMLFRGGSFALRRNPVDMMKLLIDIEMKPFRGIETPVIFLQNVVTDLLLGFGWKDLFREYADYVNRRYHARPGFMTLNMPALVTLLREAGVERPVVCSAINKIGFQMNPGVAAYERTLAGGGFDAVAMSCLASGAIPAEEAMRYVASLPNVASVLFGASRPSSIRDTKQILDRLLAPARAPAPVHVRPAAAMANNAAAYASAGAPSAA